LADEKAMIEHCLLASRRPARFALLAAVGVLLCGQAPAETPPFSADLVVQQGSAAPAPAGRLFVLDDKVRIETPELADGFFLIDGAKSSAYFVRPAVRIYMDARRSSRLTSLFAPVDPADPCRRWQVLARLADPADTAGWHCESLGEQTIGDRNTIVYRAISAERDQFTGWIDAARKFPVRIKTADDAIITVENVRDETQPSQSFEIPSNFRKFDPASLLRQIKQSDVWVEP
jgi:hypothetical protein